LIEPITREPRIEAELCPRCGTPYQPGQEYCLDCGVRLPSARLTAPLRRAWESRLPYPGDWVWPVIVGLLVAGLAGAVVIAVSNDAGGKTTLVATEPPVKGARTTTTTRPPESSTVAQSTTPRARPRPSAPAANRLVTWPRARAGWTVVLESVPKAGDGRSVAVRTAKAALRGGLPQVGVLDSNRFASLHPDYYVVFSGVYSSDADATRRAGRAQSNGYPKAYVRQITP
jgi:hypothetical protein